MLPETLKSLFVRDLNRLKNEIESYREERNIWKVENGIANSAGNLCLHLVGNLNTYIGREIGKTDYVRNREQEFSLKNVPRLELIKLVNNTIAVVIQSLDGVDESSLKEEFPVLVFEEKTTKEYLLVHLATHLTYHLGQINYHRRLIDSK